MLWTEAREQTLSRLWEIGHTPREIAAELGDGCTRNAVIGKAHRLNLQKKRVGRKRVTPEERALRELEKKLAKKAADARYYLRKLERSAERRPVPLNLPLSEWTDQTCKHIAGDDGLACGHPTVFSEQLRNSSWCAYHLSLIAVPARRRA